MTELALHSPVTALIVLLLLLGGAAIGVSLRLPVGHLDTDSRDVVKYVVGLLSTMSAVLLSLLIASAKNSYDTQWSEMQEIATKIVLLDRTLAHYGPETKEARLKLRKGLAVGIERIWSGGGADAIRSLPDGAQQNVIESFVREVQTLKPQNDMQRTLQSQALQTSAVVAQVRILMHSQSQNSLSLPFLVILVSWATCLFIGYGLFARLNATVMTALFVGALSVSGAIFLIIELNRPYTGLLQIPDTVLRNALAWLGPP